MPERNLCSQIVNFHAEKKKTTKIRRFAISFVDIRVPNRSTHMATFERRG